MKKIVKLLVISTLIIVTGCRGYENSTLDIDESTINNLETNYSSNKLSEDLKTDSRLFVHIEDTTNEENMIYNIMYKEGYGELSYNRFSTCNVSYAYGYNSFTNSNNYTYVVDTVRWFDSFEDFTTSVEYDDYKEKFYYIKETVDSTNSVITDYLSNDVKISLEEQNEFSLIEGDIISASNGEVVFKLKLYKDGRGYEYVEYDGSKEPLKVIVLIGEDNLPSSINDFEPDNIMQCMY